MPKRTLDSPSSLKDFLGQEISVTDWLNITQERIQQFADATLDHQWIHIDVERARSESPFKAPIAHGFLTLSLLSHFMHEAFEFKQAIKMGVNYGLDRVRFVSPVPAGSNIRARVVLQSLKDIPPAGMEAIFNVTIERESASKPACIAEWIVRYYL
ncbi:MAG TPA: MaoC family dehydratase [Candidatus Angelobacter sp.]|nr:MaoC family dehydratase [Candidatus Angelobacter sp.]